MNPLLEIDSIKIGYVGGLTRRFWHLAGAGAGAEGIALGEGPQALEFTPFGLILAEAARTDYATFLREKFGKKEMDFAIHIGGEGLPLTIRNTRHFLAIRDAWWRDWTAPGHLAYYTRYSGWRYQQVRMDGPAGTVIAVDPTDEHHAVYQMSVVALDGHHRAPDEFTKWVNANGFGEGVLRGRNDSDRSQWPRYTFNGPGRVHIADPIGGDTSRLVQSPVIAAGEELRINTHPGRRTARVYSAAVPSGRNVLGQMAGRKFFAPVPPWSSVEIPVRVTDGATAASAVRVDITPRHTRPF